MEGISNPKDSGDAMNDEVKTSEENNTGDIGGERYLEREKKDWRSDRKKGTCVIWCGKIPFGQLVVGAVGLRETWIWGKVRYGGASPEYGCLTPFGIMRRNKGVRSAGGQTGC